jgi:hypothetical protein
MDAIEQQKKGWEEKRKGIKQPSRIQIVMGGMFWTRDKKREVSAGGNDNHTTAGLERWT